MTYRERFLNTLTGTPVDRLPYIEWGLFNRCFTYSRWDRWIGSDTDPRFYFGFDNAKFMRGYEEVPVDWFAVPRFEATALPNDGRYIRRIEPSYGQVVRELPTDPLRPMVVQVFEDHPVKGRDDWLRFKERFKLTTEGRFPSNWSNWCEHAKSADHPIGLLLRGPTYAASAAMGLEGDTGMLLSVYDRPELLAEILDHFLKLAMICTNKVLEDSRVDLVVLIDDVGGDSGTLFGPATMKRFFLPAVASLVSLIREYGVELILLRQRGNLNDVLDLYVSRGINGLYGVNNANGMQLGRLLERYGDTMCFIGGIDVRVLRGSNKTIEEEVMRKVDLARRGRIIPCLGTHILPETTFDRYRYYASALRKAIGPLDV